MRSPTIVAALLLLAGCGAVPEVEAAPSGHAPEIGDSNGDGAVDLADGTFLLGHLMAGGPRAVCWGAADVIQDGRVELGDAFAIWYHLFVGNTVLPELDRAKCSDWDTLGDAFAANLAFEIDAPRRVNGTGRLSFTAAVQLHHEGGSKDGWSLGVHSEGCTVTAASQGSTLDSIVSDEIIGFSVPGFARTDLTGTGDAVSAVVISWLEPEEILFGSSPMELLVVEVEGLAPMRGCTDCTLSLRDGLSADGEPVSNMVALGGRSYHPALPEAKTKICAE